MIQISLHSLSLGDHLYGGVVMRASHRAIGHCMSPSHVCIVCSDEILGRHRAHEKCDPTLPRPGHFKIDNEPGCESFIECCEITDSIPADRGGRFDVLFHND